MPQRSLFQIRKTGEQNKDKHSACNPALTRQRSKIIILHQGAFSDFFRFISEEYSATARRFTDLFGNPAIKEMKEKYYDSRYINISARGESHISKSEVIIANILHQYEKKGQITYAYESKFLLDDGRKLKPDFTIEHISTGRKFLWEHHGLMVLQSYREKSQLKKNAHIDTFAKKSVPSSNKL